VATGGTTQPYKQFQYQIIHLLRTDTPTEIKVFDNSLSGPVEGEPPDV